MGVSGDLVLRLGPNSEARLTLPLNELIEALPADATAAISAGNTQLTAPNPRWLTVRAAAEHLSLSQNSIRALIKRNRIPHYKVEGRILFDQRELDDWIRRGGSTV